MDEETKAIKKEEYNRKNKEYDGKVIRILDNEFEMSGEAARNEALLEYLATRGHEAVETTKIIRDLSVEIAHFIFRNGPVEGMHSGNHSLEHFTEIPHDTPLKDISQLSEKDMEILNKFMVDRIGYLLTLYQQAEYTKLRGILRPLFPSGVYWDSPNIEKVEECINYRWR